jgi:ribose 5-phosphate isomerase A
MDATLAKRQAAEAALQLLPERGVIGLGSGSTSRLFIEGLGQLVARGRDFSGVATSIASRDLAVAVGVPLLPDAGPWQVDVCVDGADEVNPELDLIKGGGGCHAREKIVNQAAQRNIIIVDESKLSQRLGEKWAIPLEVLRFGWLTLQRELETLGTVQLRLADDQPYVTDAGNFILDVNVGPIGDPAAMDRRLRCLPGVVETGLFVQRADVVLVAGVGGVRALTRPG